MLKYELIEAVAEDSGEPQAAVRRMLESLTNVGLRELREHRVVNLGGLGRLYPAVRVARPANDLHTGQKILVAAHMLVKYRPSAAATAAANVLPVPAA